MCICFDLVLFVAAVLLVLWGMGWLGLAIMANDTTLAYVALGLGLLLLVVWVLGRFLGMFRRCFCAGFTSAA